MESTSEVAIAEDYPDYPIVYVRVPRPYPKTYSGINHLNQAGLHQTNAPGAELRLLHPDGRDESLVPVEPHESITDPVVSFDAQWAYFAKFHNMNTGPSASMTMLQSRKGSDIYKVHVASRKVVQLTTQTRTPNTGAIPAAVDSRLAEAGASPIKARPHRVGYQRLKFAFATRSGEERVRQLDVWYPTSILDKADPQLESYRYQAR